MFCLGLQLCSHAKYSTHVVSRYSDLGYFISINGGPLNVPTPFYMIGTAKGINNINTTSLWEIFNTKCERPTLCFDPIFHFILVFGCVCVNVTHECPPDDRWINMEYSLDKLRSNWGKSLIKYTHIFREIIWQMVVSMPVVCQTEYVWTCRHGVQNLSCSNHIQHNLQTWDTQRLRCY